MTLRRLVLTAALLSAPLHIVASASAQTSSAISQDPAPNKSAPAAIETFQLPSHGALLNALVYLAAGPGPHPTVILLHGFPGNEKNLDLAQAIRRDSWNVLYFDYRGSWGSPGDFSFTHCIEDVQSAVTYLRNPANAAKLRADGKTIVLVGHSMGGFMTLQTAALDPAITALVTISAADMGTSRLNGLPLIARDRAVRGLSTSLAAEGMAPLAGTSPDALAGEVYDNAAKWDFPSLAPKLASRPMLVVTSDDGLAGQNDAFLAAVQKAGNQQVTTLHLPTDHSYSDRRIALEQSVLNFLDHLKTK